MCVSVGSLGLVVGSILAWLSFFFFFNHDFHFPAPLVGVVPTGGRVRNKTHQVAYVPGSTVPGMIAHVTRQVACTRYVCRQQDEAYALGPG